MIALINFEWTINPTTIICSVFFPILIALYMRKERRKDKERTMTKIRQDAIISTVFFSANGKGQELRVYFQKEVDRGMKENNFLDGE